MKSSDPTSDDDEPLSVAPKPRLPGWGFTFLLVTMCLLPLCGLTTYAVLFGRPLDAALPVEVGVGREPVETSGGQGAVMTDILWLQSHFDRDLPNVTIDLNGQYFLYRQAPLRPGERLVLPQQIFSTKSSQRWVPGRYPITEINVTAKLPSGRRAVKTVRFESEP